MSNQNKPGTSLLETFKDEIAGGKSVAGALVDLMKGIRDTVVQGAQSQGQEISQAVGKALSNIDGLVNEAQAAVSEKDAQAAKDADAQNVKPEDIQKIVADVLSGNTPNETGLKVGEATTDGEYFTAEGSNLILGKLFLLGLEVRGLLPELPDFVFERIGFEERNALSPEIRVVDNIEFAPVDCDTDFDFLPINVNEDTAFHLIDYLIIKPCPEETTRTIEICIPQDREQQHPIAIFWLGEGTPPDNLFDPNNGCPCCNGDDHQGEGGGELQVLAVDYDPEPNDCNDDETPTAQYIQLFWVPHNDELCLSLLPNQYVPLTQQVLDQLNLTLEQALDILFIYPPRDSDEEFTLEVTLIATGPGGEVTVVTKETEVNVLAVADTPCVTVTTTMGMEDPVVLGDAIKDYSQFGKITIDANLQDNDGSEYLSAVDVKGILTGSQVYIMGGEASALGFTVVGPINAGQLYLLYDSTDESSDFTNFNTLVTHTAMGGEEQIHITLPEALGYTTISLNLYVDPPADYPSADDSSMQIVVQVTATERATGEDVFLQSANSEDNDCAKADLCFGVVLDKDFVVKSGDNIIDIDRNVPADIFLEESLESGQYKSTVFVASEHIVVGPVPEDVGSGSNDPDVQGGIKLPPILLQTGESQHPHTNDLSELTSSNVRIRFGTEFPFPEIPEGLVFKNVNGTVYEVGVFPDGEESGINEIIIPLSQINAGNVFVISPEDSSDDLHFFYRLFLQDYAQEGESEDPECASLEEGIIYVPVDIKICPVVDDLVVVSGDDDADAATNYLGSASFDEDIDPEDPTPLVLNIFTSIKTGEAVNAAPDPDDGSEVITKILVSGFLPGTIVTIPGFYENIIVEGTDDTFTILQQPPLTGPQAAAILNAIKVILPQVEHLDGEDADDCPDEVDGKIPDLVAHIKYVITVFDSNLNTIAPGNDDDSCPDATKDFTYTLDLTIKDVNKDPVIEVGGQCESECECDCITIDYQNLPNFNFGTGYADAEAVDDNTPPDNGVKEGFNFTGNGEFKNPGLVDISTPVNATVYFQHEGAGFKNTLGYYLVDDATGEITNVRIIWKDASDNILNGGGASPTDGTSAPLGVIPTGFSLGFFMLPDAASVNGANANSINHYTLNPDGTPVGGHFEFRDDTNGDPASITTPTPSLYFVPDSGPVVQIQTEYNSEGSQGIWHTAVNSAGDNSNLHIDSGAFNKPHAIQGVTDDGLILVTFEDLINGGDKDFEDLMFYVKMEPVSALCDITITEPDGDCIMKAVVTLCGIEGDKFLLPASLDGDGKDANGLTWVLNEDGTVLTITGDAEPEVYSQILDALLSWDGENNNLGGQIEIQPAMDDNGPIPGERTVKYVVYDQLADLEGEVPSTDPTDGISVQKECCFDLRNHLPPEVTIEKQNGTEDQRDAYIQVSAQTVHPATEDLTYLVIHHILTGTKLFIDPLDVAGLHLTPIGVPILDGGLFELNSANFSNVSQMGADLIITYNPADHIDLIANIKLFVQPPADYPTATDETLNMTVEATSTDGVTDKSTTDYATVAIHVDLDMADIKVMADLDGNGTFEQIVPLQTINALQSKNINLGDVTPTTPALEDSPGISIPALKLQTGEAANATPGDDGSEEFIDATLSIYVLGTGFNVPWDLGNLPKLFVNNIEMPLTPAGDNKLEFQPISMANIEAGNIKIVPPKDSSDNISFDLRIGVRDESADPDTSINPNVENGTVLIQGLLVVQPVVDDLYVNDQANNGMGAQNLGNLEFPEDSNSENPAVNPVTVLLNAFASINTGEAQHALPNPDDGSEVITKVLVSGFIPGMVVTIPFLSIAEQTIGSTSDEFLLEFPDGKTGTEVANILNAITVVLPQVEHTDSNPNDDEDCNDTAEDLVAHIQYVITVQDDNHNNAAQPDDDSPVTKDFTYTLDLTITDVNKDPVIETSCGCDDENGGCLQIDLSGISIVDYTFPEGLPDAEEVLATLNESTQVTPNNPLGLIDFIQTHPVTVYFNSEGAGYQNTLGYYFVDGSGNITNVNLIWPNASADGSGGELLGDTNGASNVPTDGSSFTIGDVPAGMKLGFFLLPNAFSQGGTGNIDSISNNDGSIINGTLEFRNADMSPATTSSDAPLLYYVPTMGAAVAVPTQYGPGVAWHSAALPDAPNLNSDDLEHTFQALTDENLLAVGFEDLQGGGDQDYNDLIFFVDVGPANVRGNLDLCEVKVTEPDNDCIVKAVVTISGNEGDKFLLPMDGQLHLNGHDYTIVYGVDDNQVIITGDGPAADYDQMLDVLLSLNNVYDNPEGRLEVYLAQTGNGAVAGERTISYTVYDVFGDVDGTNSTNSDGISNTGECCFNVTNNLPPLAKDDKYEINEDGELVVAANGLLGNDSDPDSGPNPLVITTFSPGDNFVGLLTVNIDGGFEYTPPANFSGCVEFDYTITDGSATSTATAMIFVKPIADKVNIVGDNIVDGDEDTLIAVPTQTFQLTDTDGSETANAIKIYFDPTKVDHLEYNSATLISAVDLDGTFVTIPVSGTADDPALLEKNETFSLSGLEVKPKGDSSDDFTLTFKITNTDKALDCDDVEHTDTQTSSKVLDVHVCPVVDDGAKISFDNVDEHGVCIAEDATEVTLNNVVYQSIDLPDFKLITGEEKNAGGDGLGDQSEQFTYLVIQIPNIPEGSKLFVEDLAHNQVEIGYDSGTHTFGPISPSDDFGSIEDQLDTLQIMLPKDWSGSLDLQFKATVTDAGPDDTGVDGKCAPDGKFFNDIGSLHLVVESVIDQPLIVIGEAGSEDDCIVACEDEKISVPAVKITATDVDGSEDLTALKLCFNPANVDHFTLGNETFNSTTMGWASGEIEIPVNLLTQVGEIYTLNGLEVFPPANSDRDIKLTFKATVSEVNPTDCDDLEPNQFSKEVQADFNIKIMPVAEEFQFDPDSISKEVDEDNWVNLTPGLTLSIPDQDGSENLSQIAFCFDGSKVDKINIADAIFSVNGSGDWVDGETHTTSGGLGYILHVDGDGNVEISAINYTSFLDNFTNGLFGDILILPAKDSSDDFDVTIKVTSTDHDSEGKTYAPDPDCVPEKVSEFVIPVKVNPVVDDLHLNNADFSINTTEVSAFALPEIAGNEGTTVTLLNVFNDIRTGEAQHALPNADDGSEKITTISLTGFPVGAVVHIPDIADTTITDANKNTPLVLNNPTGNLDAILDGVTIKLPAVDGANLLSTLLVKFTVVDDNHNNTAAPDDDAPATKDFFYKIPLAICNVDTAPTLAVTPHVGTEDKNDAYIKIAADVGDSDPSEHLKSLKIAEVPTDAKLFVAVGDVAGLGLTLAPGHGPAVGGFYELNTTNFSNLGITLNAGKNDYLITLNNTTTTSIDKDIHVQAGPDLPSSTNAHIDLKIQVVSTDSGNNNQSSPLTPAKVLFNVDLDISDFKVTFDNVLLSGGVSSTSANSDVDSLLDKRTFAPTTNFQVNEDGLFTLPKLAVATGESQHPHADDGSESVNANVLIKYTGPVADCPYIVNNGVQTGWNAGGTYTVSLADLNAGKIQIKVLADNSNDLSFSYCIDVKDKSTDVANPTEDLGQVIVNFGLKVLPVVDNMFINNIVNDGTADQALGNLNGVENTPLALNVFTNIQTGEAGNATPGDDGSEKILSALLSGFPVGAVVHVNGGDITIANASQTINVTPPVGPATWQSVLDAITVKLPVVNTPTVDFDVKVKFTVQDTNFNNPAAPDDDTAVTKDFTAKFHVKIADGNNPPEVTCVVNTETIDQTIPFEFQGGQLKSVAETLSILNEGTQLNASYINNLGVIDLPNPHPVKVHFFNEGAGFKNSFGYYLVDENGNIGQPRIIWNNASANGSGGLLIKGDDGDSNYTDGSTFDIGTLPAGSHLAFFLLPDAFSESGTVSGQINMADIALNADGTPANGHFEFRDGTGGSANVANDFAPSLWYVPNSGTPSLVKTNYPFDYPGGQKGFAAWHTAAGEANASDLNQDVGLLPNGHVIQALTNDNKGLILMGFEDLYGNKASNGSDEDYNDILFFVEVGPANVQSNAAVIDVTVTDPDVGDFISQAVVTLTGQPGDKILLPTAVGFTYVLSNNDTILTITGVNKTPADFSNLLDTSVSSDNVGGAGIELLLAKGLNGDYIGGQRTLDYVVTDNHGAVSQHDTCSFTVTASVKPTAIDDTAHADEDMPVIIKVLANDTDPTNQALSLVSVTGATNGTVTMNADGTIKYTPSSFWDSLANGATGTDSFNYTMKDADGNTDTGRVDVTIHGAADRTSASNDFPLPYGTALDPDAPDALKNILLAEFLESNLKGNNTYFDATSTSSTTGNDKISTNSSTTSGQAGQDYMENTSNSNSGRTMSGDDGNDILYGSGSAEYTLNGGNHGDVLIGGSNDDTLNGGNGNDFLFGSGGDDTLNGDAGNDFLLGGSGDDTLSGGDGADTLFGGTGDDSLTGGNGNDLFVYDLARSDWGDDTISGIELKSGANGDHLVFGNVVDGPDSGTTLSTADLIAAGYKVSEFGSDVFIKNDGSGTQEASEIRIEGLASSGNYNTGTEQAKWDLLTSKIHVDISGTPS